LKGEKRLFKIGDVRFINVPRLPELGVRKMLKLIEDHEDILMYMPPNFKKQRTIDRNWIMNIINTCVPGWLTNLIEHA
jgi:hypothetical protein